MMIFGPRDYVTGVYRPVHLVTPSDKLLAVGYIGSNKKLGGIQTGKMSGWGQRLLDVATRWVWGCAPPENFLDFRGYEMLSEAFLGQFLMNYFYVYKYLSGS